ncbi:hypothetical protein Lsan_3957 [Legionella santicrucis]|uniref:Muconolactone isomerase domain-containing protein n=1 Tax=Legionella santicrucis TaxID=45074 RepID=A0A0W0Y9B4_9GAMM|nr:hypothetical protein [Legionella santicrucis]KTD53547.1 hypothetical protein Lsan_3957 [Legionella santicrucis]
MMYLVTASQGPGFASNEETIAVLENGILATFDMLIQLERMKKIIAGGVLVGDRAFSFILDASSNDEVDQLLREIPGWGVLKWKVVPLQSFQSRANQERNLLTELKK